jgi:predicted HTH domain antitoxin
MSSTLSIEILHEIAHATKMTPSEFRCELTIYLFSTDKL